MGIFQSDRRGGGGGEEGGGQNTRPPTEAEADEYWSTTASASEFTEGRHLTDDSSCVILSWVSHLGGDGKGREDGDG